MSVELYLRVCAPDVAYHVRLAGAALVLRRAAAREAQQHTHLLVFFVLGVG